jgi:ketol-acid reductoisomerase
MSSPKIAILGFGSQGSAQANNLHASGYDITVLLRANSPRINQAKAAGLPVRTDLPAAINEAQIIALLIPDGEQARVYQEVLAPNMQTGACLVFAHGFSLHYNKIQPRPDLDTILVAPMSNGQGIRDHFKENLPLPCILAIHQNASGKACEKAKHFAKGISKLGPFISSSIQEEVETDLFAEQVVLCGGINALIKNSFEVLVEAGYNPKIAYTCCLQELKASTTLLFEHGIAGFRDRTSDTAQFGDVTRGPRIISQQTKSEMKKILAEIQDGSFAKELDQDNKNKRQVFNKLYNQDKAHEIEKTRQKLLSTLG